MNTDNFQWDDNLVLEFMGKYSRMVDEGHIKDFKESKQRKPILVTKDGIPQYKEDRPWYVNDKFELGGSADLNRNAKYHPAIGYYYFSTQEVAERFIIENKPCLSVNDIMALVMSTNQMPDYRANIIQLAKNKIGVL